LKETVKAEKAALEADEKPPADEEEAKEQEAKKMAALVDKGV